MQLNNIVNNNDNTSMQNVKAAKTEVHFPAKHMKRLDIDIVSDIVLNVNDVNDIEKH